MRVREAKVVALRALACALIALASGVATVACDLMRRAGRLNGWAYEIQSRPDTDPRGPADDFGNPWGNLR